MHTHINYIKYIIVCHMVVMQCRKKYSWEGGYGVQGALEVGVLNMVVRKSFTEKLSLEQGPENIWGKSILGGAVHPRVPSRIVPGMLRSIMEASMAKVD